MFLFYLFLIFLVSFFSNYVLKKDNVETFLRQIKKKKTYVFVYSMCIVPKKLWRKWGKCICREVFRLRSFFVKLDKSTGMFVYVYVYLFLAFSFCSCRFWNLINQRLGFSTGQQLFRAKIQVLLLSFIHLFLALLL